MSWLVLAALGIVLVVALVLGATGELPFGPGPLLLGLLVATAATSLGTLTGAVLTRSRPYLPSSLITGAILTLVLPAGLGAELAALAVSGAVAGVSKYLLAWRGRHLLNPAVVGLLVVGWSGLGASWWWVGSEALAPVVAVTGLVVLWRTRRLAYAGSYAVVALVAMTLGYRLLAVPLGDAAWFALTASPVLFLGAFMLSEPLTTPGRQWQRVLVGGGVGLASAAPLLWHWGWLTPELALAIGNLIAFGFARRGGIVLRLASRRITTAGLLELSFLPSASLRFAPGQYLELDVAGADDRGARFDPRGRRRVLSVASAPGAPEVRLVTRMTAAGPAGGGAGAGASPVKRVLADLAPGAPVRVTTVGGDFVLPRGAARQRLALVGAGIGVTPFLSHLDAIARGELAAPPGGWDVVLVHAVREVGEVLEVLSGASRGAGQGLEVPGGGVLGALPARAGLPAGIDLVLVVPPGAEASAVPVGWRIVEGALLTRDVLARAVPDLRERTVLVSGSPMAVSAVRSGARALGVRRVRTDVFLGY